MTGTVPDPGFIHKYSQEETWTYFSRQQIYSCYLFCFAEEVWIYQSAWHFIQFIPCARKLLSKVANIESALQSCGSWRNDERFCRKRHVRRHTETCWWRNGEMSQNTRTDNAAKPTGRRQRRCSPSSGKWPPWQRGVVTWNASWPKLKIETSTRPKWTVLLRLERILKAESRRYCLEYLEIDSFPTGLKKQLSFKAPCFGQQNLWRESAVK